MSTPESRAGRAESAGTEPVYDPLVEHYRDQIRQHVEGRPIIMAMGVVAAMTGAVKRLAELGAGPMLCLGHAVGTGDLPDSDLAAWHLVGDDPPVGSDLNEQLRHYQRALTHPPPDIQAIIERFDPDREALVLPSFPVDFEALGDRPNDTPRKPEWIALEDKLVADPLWDALGVPRAPVAVVASRREALAAAHAELDQGAGTVWAGDARDGFHGGAARTRWVRRPSELDAAVEFFASRADQVRVMPFLEGIPCSVHAMVLDDGIAVFRPCEMMIFRRPGSIQFQYAGASTYWDPAPADRDEMRATARRVAEGLRDRYAYRGTFTIDGIMTADGFRPTELNPRFGAAIQTMTGGLAGLPLTFLDLFLRGGFPIDAKAAELEAAVLTAADANRSGGGWTIGPGLRTETTRHSVVRDADGLRFAGDDEEPHGTITIGPAPEGVFSRFIPARAHTPVGASLAPLVAEAFAFCDAHLGTQLGALECARDVRK